MTRKPKTKTRLAKSTTDAFITLRVPIAVRKQLEELAHSDARTLGNYVRLVLQQYLATTIAKVNNAQ